MTSLVFLHVMPALPHLSWKSRGGLLLRGGLLCSIPPMPRARTRVLCPACLLQVEQSHIAEDVIRDFEDHIEYAEAECITGMRQRGDSRRYQIKCVTLQLTVMCLPLLQAVHHGAVPKAAGFTQPAPQVPCHKVQLASIVYQL